MKCLHKIYVIALVALFILGISGCSEEVNTLTSPQSRISVSSVSIDVANLIVNRSDATEPAVHEAGTGARVDLWAAGDYMIGYTADTGGMFYLFFRAGQPVSVTIGVNEGSLLDMAIIYYDFTFIDADAAALTEEVGDADFYWTSGLPYEDEATAVNYYAAIAQSITFYR